MQRRKVNGKPRPPSVGYAELVRQLMKLSKRSRWIILLASGPLVWVTLYLALWPVPEDPPPPRYLAVAFAGYTNDARGQALPQFTLSNVSTFRIECFPIGAQVQMTNRSRTSTNVFWNWQSGYTTQFLRAGEVTRVTVVPPTTAVPWRFAVLATRPATPVQRAADKLESRLPRRIYWLVQGDPRNTQLIQYPVVQAQPDEAVHKPQ